MHQTSQIEGHLGKASRSGSLREQVCTSLRSEECPGSFQRDDLWVYNVQDHNGRRSLTMQQHACDHPQSPKCLRGGTEAQRQPRLPLPPAQPNSVSRCKAAASCRARHGECAFVCGAQRAQGCFIASVFQGISPHAYTWVASVTVRHLADSGSARRGEASDPPLRLQ
jgi:hypothetical protein